MLIHMVCFKYKADVDAASRADHWQRLRGLKDLEGVVDLKVGPDVVRSPRSFDAGLIVTLPDRAALEAYAKNPTHIPVAQMGPAMCEAIVAVDFEA